MTLDHRYAVPGRRLNPLFPLAETPDQSKPFAPLQAVQQFASQVQSQIRSRFDNKDKDKDKASKQSAVDAIAEAAAATKARPSESQTHARTLVKNLSNKGFVLAKTSPASSEPIAVSPAAIVSKEELGRATWTLLHTLAVQYPQTPTKQQQKDVKTLVRFCCMKQHAHFDIKQQ